MVYAIPALLIAALIITILLVVRHISRKSDAREAAELSRIAALPLNLRAEALSKARIDRAAARTELKAARARFNHSWGYRHNPAFTRLVVAQAVYESASAWLRKLEALCASNRGGK